VGKVSKFKPRVST